NFDSPFIQDEDQLSRKEGLVWAGDIPCGAIRVLDRIAGSSPALQRTTGGTEQHSSGRRCGSKRHVAKPGGPGRHYFDDGGLLGRRFESSSSGMEDAGDIKKHSLLV